MKKGTIYHAAELSFTLARCSIQSIGIRGIHPRPIMQNSIHHRGQILSIPILFKLGGYGSGLEKAPVEELVSERKQNEAFLLQ
jgi:hypothetical protein